MTPYESVHVQVENIELQMTAHFIAWVGEHQPADEGELLDKLLTKAGLATIFQGFAQMLHTSKERGMVEKEKKGLYRLTQTGEALFIVARGKPPKGSRYFAGITPELARKISEAWNSAQRRRGQKEAV